MATNTTRAGFIKPTTLEPRAIGPINSNSDRADELLGAFLINDGATIPDSQAIDGMIVKEKTSGKMWVLQKNVGGTFDKRYIRFPYLYRAFTNFAPTGSSTAYADYGANTYIGGVNSSAAEMQAVTGFWVCPLSGIYTIRCRARWAANATGLRAVRQKINGTDTQNETEMIVGNAGTSFSSADSWDVRSLAAGDVVGSQQWQNSGGTLNTWMQYDITMIEPAA